MAASEPGRERRKGKKAKRKGQEKGEEGNVLLHFSNLGSDCFHLSQQVIRSIYLGLHTTIFVCDYLLFQMRRKLLLAPGQMSDKLHKTHRRSDSNNAMSLKTFDRSISVPASFTLIIVIIIIIIIIILIITFVRQSSSQYHR